MKVKNFLFIILLHNVMVSSKLIVDFKDTEEHKIMVEIVVNNLKSNGWINIFFMGNLPDLLYNNLQNLPVTFAVADTVTEEVQIEDVVPYSSNIIIMNCTDFEDFERSIKKITGLPYWHPLANIILYYQAFCSQEIIAKIFFIFWYFRALNVIIIQRNGALKEISISYFSPYMSEDYKLDHLFGCWTARKIGMPVTNFEKGFVCEQQCHNITFSYSKLREKHLGTCIGFDTEIIPEENWRSRNYSNLFIDKGKNLHGFTFFAYTVQVLPFFLIEEHINGTFTFHRRDGIIWNTMAELLNFKIDITPAKDAIKQKFNYEINVLQVFSFSQRKADLVLFPLYQFDLIIAEVDYTVPFVDSGVCILSHRAGFQTIVFDVNLLQKNLAVVVEFIICFICTWFVLFIYNTEQTGRISLDQAGKDLVNTFRTILSISLHNPPNRGSFRIFLTISIWSFFVINFSTQAAIISLFSVHKREKEVDTFEDVIKKGYKIQGISSPDAVLPDTEEVYRIITSRVEDVADFFTCVNEMKNDSHRFCLIDCAVGRYLVRNMLNDKGEQFLHLATHARIHSHYLNMILHKNSPLTEHYNKYITAIFEAGLIGKWMEYSYFDSKEESSVKPLGMEDLGGIFECYIFLVGISFIIFIFEVFIGLMSMIKRNCSSETFIENVKRIKNTSMRKLTLKKKLSKNAIIAKVKVADVTTQTV